jgi:hypothetical protein
MALRALKGSLVVGLTLAVLAAAAHAGEYHVYSCRTPDGVVAPTDGWSSPEHLEYEHSVTLNTCEEGGGLVAALYANYVHLADIERATWKFEAPAGETIAAETLWRAGDTLGGSYEDASYVIYDAASTRGEIFDSCKALNACLREGNLEEPFDANNLAMVPENALGGSYLSLNASCGSLLYENQCPGGAGDSNGYAAIIELFAADLVLSQSTSPTVSAVSGGLAEDPSVQGTTDVAFHATDSGSGVYEALIQVDGHLVSHTVLNENGGRCHNVGETTDGLPAFLYTQPCPAAVSADVPFDTTGLANGVHHVVVTVTDAAGNATTVLDRELTVANLLPPPSPPPETPEACASTTAGGTGAAHVTLTARWGSLAGARRRGPRPRGAHLQAPRPRGPRLRGRYGAAHLIEGRLTGPTGTPLADAPLEVCELPDFTGAHARLLATPRTAADGDWSLTLPRNLPSCVLRLDYRAAPLDPLPEATRTLTLSVPAALPLHITPRTAPSEGAIRFSGRLLGSPLPAGGKQLVLEARAPGARWLEFHVIHTGAHGRFGFLYRFRLPGPAHYQFRVLCEPEADFPFAAGASNVVGVFER